MEATLAAERALMAAMRNLLSEAAQEFARQFAASQGELDRAQGLLAEAIESLTASFHGLATGTAQHEAELAKAITALQFQDMVSQLLSHVARRLEALERVMRELDGLAGALDHDAATNDLPAAVASVTALQGKIAAALRSLPAQTRNNPVGQCSMAGGDIELF
ncbi:MAG: hypothetical protein N3C63_02560 [Rhodocyclaceae bacterium]|nr:hypothetical protein [Rhodocyclaceae bacterium]